jgi:hypothetical protein
MYAMSGENTDGLVLQDDKSCPRENGSAVETQLMTRKR